jgi:predicted permease
MTLSQDLPYVVRQLRRAPGFALTVVLTLALGIGANLAIFQLLHGALFTRLPVAQPSQLYSLHAVKSPFDGQWFFSYPAYQHLRQATVDVAPVIARSGISEGVLRPSGRSPERVSIQMVSDNFFDVLGISPASGRFFFRRDEELGQYEQPVVLRYGFWKQSFGAGASVVGKQAVLNGVPVIIVGIAPDRFSGVVAGEAPDLWLPIGAQATGRFHSWFDSLGPGSGADIRAPYMNQASVFWLWVLARVPDAAQSSSIAHWTEALEPDLTLLASASRDHREQEQILRCRVELISAASGEGTLREDYSESLIILMAMAGLVLLVGCVNLANLQLARLLSRQRELTVRASLGASRWRLLRQLLLEDLLLAVIGAVLALVIGRAASSLLLQWASGSGPTIPLDLHVGWEAFAFGGALLLVALTGFSLLPAWQITRNNLADNMKSRANSSSPHSRTARKWSSLLLAGQVSFSLLLLGMAALFADTLVNLSQINAGLDREHLISIHLDFTNAAYNEDYLPALYGRMIARLKELPGVKDAVVQMCAIPGCIWNTAIHVSGHPEISEKLMHGEENRVGAGYFHTLGIPILQGRDFDERDLPTSQAVAILNHSFARKLFGNESPIGHRIGYETAPHDADYLVVGEAGDARVDDLRSLPPPVAYFSIDQRPSPAGTVEVRASGHLGVLYSPIRQTLLSVDPHLPITDIVPLNAEYEDGLFKETLLARLTAAFGLLALALAALGFYGLLSFNVTRRTSEIGIRIAIGATRGDIYTLVLRQTMGILIAGIVPGLVFTEVMGFVVRNLLFGTGTLNFWPLLLAICVLVTVGVLTALRPAHRAALIDPVKALRAD